MSGRNNLAAFIAIILMLGGGYGFLAALANIHPYYDSDQIDPDWLALCIAALVVVAAGVWLARIEGGWWRGSVVGETGGELKEVATEKTAMSGEWFWFAVIFGLVLLLFGGGCVVYNLYFVGTAGIELGGSELLIFGVPGWIALGLGWWLLSRSTRRKNETNPDGTRPRKFDPPPEDKGPSDGV